MHKINIFNLIYLFLMAKIAILIIYSYFNILNINFFYFFREAIERKKNKHLESFLVF